MADPRPYDGPLDLAQTAIAAEVPTGPASLVQWGRRVRVTLDDGEAGVLIADHYPDRDDGLHVSAEIELNTQLAPQPCRIEVWGLSAERREQLTAKQKQAMNTAWLTRKTRRIGRLRVEAGRVGAFGVVFAGMIMRIEHNPDGADWRTTITAQDGRLEWANARVSESIAPGVALADFEAVLRASEEALLGKEPFEAFAGQFKGLLELKSLGGYEQGFALMGNSIEQNQRLCDALHLEPFWLHGRFMYVPRGRSTRDRAVVLVRGDTLLHETEIERGYRNAIALLDHRTSPGRQILLTEDDGRPIGARAHRADSVKRIFSTWDAAWYDHLALRPTTPLPPV